MGELGTKFLGLLGCVAPARLGRKVSKHMKTTEMVLTLNYVKPCITNRDFAIVKAYCSL